MTIEELKANYDVINHTEEGIEIPIKPSGGLVLLVGSSGSGKSTILREWFENQCVSFNCQSVISNFSSISNGERLLKSFGLITETALILLITLGRQAFFRTTLIPNLPILPTKQ